MPGDFREKIEELEGKIEEKILRIRRVKAALLRLSRSGSMCGVGSTAKSTLNDIFGELELLRARAAGVESNLVRLEAGLLRH